MGINKRAMGADGDRDDLQDHIDEQEAIIAREAMLSEIKMIVEAELPKFRPGDRVWKAGGYEGPGEVVAAFRGKDDLYRYVVAHVIEGGKGELLHIYAEGQLTKLVK